MLLAENAMGELCNSGWFAVSSTHAIVGSVIGVGATS